jgi:hypothetical protein
MQEDPRIGAVLMCRMDHVRRNCDVVVDELGAQRIVGDNAADLGGARKITCGRILANQSNTAACCADRLRFGRRSRV